MALAAATSSLNHHQSSVTTTTNKKQYLMINKIQLIIFFFQILLYLLLLIIIHLQPVRSSSNKQVVSHLPGLKLPGEAGKGGDGGPLPFHLETGYIGVGESMGVQLFYYFVESERDPREDPLVLWLTGGPRCSAFSAFAFEIGPIYFDKVEYNGNLPTLVLNPNSWTKIANVIFLDAPVDTGFSYSEFSSGSSIGDLESAEHIYEFLRKWLIENPKFQSNPLYIGGDSYSGIIIPILVQEVVDDIDAGKYPFLNFKGYILGNPGVHSELEKNSIVPFAHGMGLISMELYESMKENCKGNYLGFDLTNVNCSKDREAYEQCISGIFTAHILEPNCALDSTIDHKNKTVEYRRSLVTRTIDIDVPDLLPPFLGCRNYDYTLSYYWANDDHVQEALHIKKGTVKNWIRCHFDLPYEYEVKSSIEYLRNLSTKGYRSLIYSGDHDTLVTHISTEAWIRSLNLPISDDWRPWLLRGQVGGYTRSYANGMTYATVKGGGHTAPEYKPEECFAMFERWVSHNPL